MRVSEQLSNGSKAIYDYDMKVRVGLAPITIKHVYAEDKLINLPNKIIQDDILKYNGMNTTIAVSAPDLIKNRYHFKKMVLDQTEISSTSSYNVTFKEHPQTLYIMYSGESWLESITGNLEFKGVLTAEQQLLDPRGDEPMTIQVRSTELKPNWRLLGKVTPFVKLKLAVSLYIDGHDLSMTPTVIHHSQSVAEKITIGRKDLATHSRHKPAELFIGNNSYHSADTQINYEAAITWQVKSDNNIIRTKANLPTEEGIADD